MWELKKPLPVKLIIGILAADTYCLQAAIDELKIEFGTLDLQSDVWSFTQTDYYRDELGTEPLRQFVTVDKLIDPGDLAKIKHKTNRIEQKLAKDLGLALPRPINLDPGIIELSKLVLASTKNFSHRIYIGESIYAELTLMYNKGGWQSFEYTFPDYKQGRYFVFFNIVRNRLLEQLRE